MAKRMPPRNAKGRFVKRARASSSTKRRRRKSNPPRARAAAAAPRRRRRRNPSRSVAKRAAPRRRSRRRNPPRVDPIGVLKQGAQDALALTAGQVAGRLGSRFLANTLGLPRGGMVGLATTAAIGVGIGVFAENLVSRETARMITAGALSVPLQEAALTYLAPHVPLVAPALTPTTLGRYPRRTGVGAYPRRELNASRANGRAVAGRLKGYDYTNGAAWM